MNNQYRLNQVVDALQLRWDTWGEMCDFAGVGHFVDGKPEGVYGGIDTDLLCLKIPVRGKEPRIASLSDYIIKLPDGSLHVVPEYLFEVMFSEIEENK
jgi:hypothetical protein